MAALNRAINAGSTSCEVQVVRRQSNGLAAVANERTMSDAGRAQKFPSATSWRIDRSSSFLGQQLLQPGVPLLQLLEALGIHARQ